MENIDIARVFEGVADLLDPGRQSVPIRAYRNAARTVEYPARFSGVARGGRSGARGSQASAGIFAAKMREILETGELTLLRELTQTTPKTLIALLRIPGLGPKRARLIHNTLGVKTLDDLENAAREGRLRGIKGIGETIEQTVLRGVARIAPVAGASSSRMLSSTSGHSSRGCEHCRKSNDLEVSGSYRRRSETVGDVDILVSAAAGGPIAEAFVHVPEVSRVLAQGGTKCSIVLKAGLQVDLRVVPAKSFGAALHYFTGSKTHNIAIRTLGVKRGLKINEYGVYRGTRRLAGATEHEVFKAVGLP